MYILLIAGFLAGQLCRGLEPESENVVFRPLVSESSVAPAKLQTSG